MREIWLLLLILIVPFIICLISWLIKYSYQPTITTPLDRLYLDNLKLCANLSLLAYTDIPGAKVITNPKMSVYAYIFQQDHKVYVVFRGTDDILDLRADFDRKLTQINPGVYVHDGIYRDYMTVYPLIIQTIKEMKGWDKIVTTGHSLGAGLALLNTYYLINDGIVESSSIECYTYGLPRPGNLNYAKFFEDKLVTRVYDFEDPIPMVPMNSDYYQPITNSFCLDKYARYDYHPRDYLPMARWLMFFNIINWNNKLDPHYIETYISHLNRLPCK